MKCPVCKNLMIVVEHDKVEVDHCVNCQGVWFDAGELELFLETKKLEDPHLYPAYFTTAPETKTTEKRRKCPICGKNMRKVTVGEKPKVLIDACPKGDGLWFDGGEVDQLISQLAEKPTESADSHGRVIRYIREVFKSHK
jgi:Zn-finger nucleic acid-binding protein